MLQHCPYVQHLRLVGVALSIPVMEILQCSNRCSPLKSLKLVDCREMVWTEAHGHPLTALGNLLLKYATSMVYFKVVESHDAMTRLRKLPIHLRSLTFNSSAWSSRKASFPLIRRQFRTLTHHSIGANFSLYVPTPMGLLHALSGAPQLRALEFTHSAPVDVVEQCLSSLCPQLEHLTLVLPPRFTARTAVELQTLAKRSLRSIRMTVSCVALEWGSLIAAMHEADLEWALFKDSHWDTSSIYGTLNKVVVVAALCELIRHCRSTLRYLGFLNLPLKENDSDGEERVAKELMKAAGQATIDGATKLPVLHLMIGRRWNWRKISTRHMRLELLNEWM